MITAQTCVKINIGSARVLGEAGVNVSKTLSRGKEQRLIPTIV